MEESLVITPMELEILLFHFYSPAPYKNPELFEKSINSAISHLNQMGLLDVSLREDAERVYDVSDKGKFYVVSILTMPLPVMRWEIPK